MWRGGRRHISDALRRVLSSFIYLADVMYANILVSGCANKSYIRLN